MPDKKPELIIGHFVVLSGFDANGVLRIIKLKYS